MMNTRRHRAARPRVPGRMRLRCALVALPLLALTGCDDLLEVRDPDVVLPEETEGASALPAVRANAIGDFAFAYVGAASNTEGQITISGLISDEFIHSGTFDTRESIDRRIAAETNPHVLSTFSNLQRARASAERAAELFAEHGPNTVAHAEVENLAGFTYVMFGENYCSGVPFSQLTSEGRLEFGEQQSTVEVFNRAIDRFEAAHATAVEAGSTTQQQLARIGQARALLGLGQYEQAAAVAADVPTEFQYVIFHSENTARQNNGVWALNNNAGRWSIPDREGTNGLPYRSEGNIDGDVQDPRIPTVHVGRAQRTGLRPFEQWAQLKYPTRASNTILAEGIEARLIEAEAALRAGDVGTFVAIHNDLRARTDDLDPLLEAEVQLMSETEREDLHFKERAYWLWLTSRRLGDLRRMLWDYGRQQEDIFPVGAHHRSGAPYGTDTNLPIPFDEQNNPNVGDALCFTRDDEAGRDG